MLLSFLLTNKNASVARFFMKAFVGLLPYFSYIQTKEKKLQATQNCFESYKL